MAELVGQKYRTRPAAARFPAVGNLMLKPWVFADYLWSHVFGPVIDTCLHRRCGWKSSWTNSAHISPVH